MSHSSKQPRLGPWRRWASKLRSRFGWLYAGMILGTTLATPACAPSGEEAGPLPESSPRPAQPGVEAKPPPPPAAAETPGEDAEVTRLRRSMVEQQLRGRDIRDPRVLQAMGRVQRHLFVPPHMRDMAYRDHPLPIGHDQTISQPYIVALMTQLAQPKPTARALDVGTGSGYQAAVLGEVVQQVYSIEILKPLADKSRQRLRNLGYKNIEVRCGDGYRGWPEKAPFDVIIVAAAPDHVPAPLVKQLAPGGRLVIPVGDRYQYLTVIAKQLDGSLQEQRVAPVAFVPMTGEAAGAGQDGPNP